jgi:hypothetical protein
MPSTGCLKYDTLIADSTRLADGREKCFADLIKVFGESHKFKNVACRRLLQMTTIIALHCYRGGPEDLLGESTPLEGVNIAD